MSFALIDAVLSIFLTSVSRYLSARNRASLLIAPPPEIRNDQPAQTWSCTHIKLVKFSHVWTINNYSYLCKNFGEMLESPTFPAGENDEIKLAVRLFPHGTIENNDTKWLSLFLHVAACKTSNVNMNFEFSLLDVEREKFNSKNSCNAVEIKRGGDSGYVHFIEKTVLLALAKQLLPNDKLKIMCEGIMSVGTVNASGDARHLNASAGRGIAEDLGLLLVTERWSDVDIWVGRRKFRAHKAILASRSSVFSAMFEHEMQERRRNRVDIIDVDDQVFVEMLRFIYTDRAMNLETIALALLAAADKYAIEGLKTMCEVAMSASISMENAIRILILGDFYNSKRLKDRAIEIINMHANELTQTIEFKSMINSHPQLIAEAFGVLAMSNEA